MYHSYPNFHNGSQNPNKPPDTKTDSKGMAIQATKFSSPDISKHGQVEGSIGGSMSSRVNGGPVNVPSALTSPHPGATQAMIQDHTGPQQINIHNFQQSPPHQIPNVQGNYYISQMSMPQAHKHTQPFVQSNQQHILQRENDFHSTIPQYSQSRVTQRIAERNVNQQNNAVFMNQQSSNSSQQVQPKQYEVLARSHVHPHQSMQYPRSETAPLSSPSDIHQHSQMNHQSPTGLHSSGIVTNVYQSPKHSITHANELSYNSNKEMTKVKDFAKDSYRQSDSGSSLSREEEILGAGANNPVPKQKKKRGRPNKLILDPSTNEYIDSSHPNFKELNKSLKSSSPTDRVRPTIYDTRMDLNADGDLSKLLYQPTYMRTLKDKAVQELIQKKDRRGRPRKFPVEQTGITIKGIRVNGTLKQRKKKGVDDFKVSKNVNSNP